MMKFKYWLWAYKNPRKAYWFEAVIVGTSLFLLVELARSI